MNESINKPGTGVPADLPATMENLFYKKNHYKLGEQ
jgi:hypothetical protein